MTIGNGIFRMTQIDMTGKNPSFEEYLAGGFVGNAPLFFFTYAVKCLLLDEGPTPILETVSALVIALGGVASGYLVARRIDRDHLRIGLKTGISSFLVNLTFSSVILEGTTIVYALYILIIFSLASVAGAYLRRIITERRKTLQDASNKPNANTTYGLSGSRLDA